MAQLDPDVSQQEENRISYLEQNIQRLVNQLHHLQIVALRLLHPNKYIPVLT